MKPYVLTEKSSRMFLAHKRKLACDECHKPLIIGQQIQRISRRPERIIHAECYPYSKKEPNRNDCFSVYVLFEKNSSWLLRNGYSLVCPLCKKPCEIGEEIHCNSVQNRNKSVFHSACYAQLVKQKRETIDKGIEQKKKRKATRNFTANSYRCAVCKEDVHALVFREKWGMRIIALLCVKCGNPIMQSGQNQTV